MFGKKLMLPYGRHAQLIIALFTRIVFFLIVSSAGAAPLHVLSSNSRYFTDGSGKAIYLTGSHTHRNFMDWGYSDPPPAFNYNSYLDFLVQHNHNFMRLWVQANFRWLRVNDSTGKSDSAHASPFPWSRTGPGVASDGRPKFDLSQLDQSYFDRVRQRVIDAGARGIYVSVMLFEGNVAGKDGSAIGSPFAAENNINGISVDQNGDGMATEAFDSSVPGLTNIQREYVAKVIDSLNDLDNVLYEICNECPPNSIQWSYNMIDFIKKYESGKPKEHPVGMTVNVDSNTSVLFASNADWVSPGNDAGDYLSNPPKADGSKVIIADSDHITYFDASAGMIWKQFTRGLNPIFMDLAFPLRDKPSLPEQELIRAAMGYTKLYADKMSLAEMVPRGDLSSTGYALANPGSEYLIYVPGGGSFSVLLSSGTYNYEWFNPRSGSLAATGLIDASKDSESFSPPFGGDAVLYLHTANDESRG